MEITGKNSSISLEAYANSLKVRERGPSENAAEGSAAAPIAQDKVVLSPRAREIAEAHKAANEAEDVRADKVDRLRQQIGGGPIASMAIGSPSACSRNRFSTRYSKPFPPSACGLTEWSAVNLPGSF